MWISISCICHVKGLCNRQVQLCSLSKSIMHYLSHAISRYVEEDLKKGLGKEPAQVLSARPMVSTFIVLVYYVEYRVSKIHLMFSFMLNS